MRADLWWTEDLSQASAAAAALAKDLACGGSLPEIEAAGLPLARNELLHASVAATCSWYGPADVTYDSRQLLLFGSTTWLGITAAASALGNRRRHASAAALASPQWRPLGNTWVLLTSERIAVPCGGSLLTLWLEDITELRRHPDPRHIEIVTCDQPVLSMYGAWVPYMGVGLSEILKHSLDRVPEGPIPV